MPIRITFRYRHANGTWIWLEVWGTTVEYKGERHMLNVARDVTERRRLEEVNRHAQKMEAIGRLAGGVVHDFNNLLTIIAVYSDVLRAQVADNAVAAADLAEIRHAAERARGVTRQLLALSRRGVPRTRVVDVNAVLRTNERMLSLLVRKEVKFEVSAGTQVLPVRADPFQIEQVLLNLVMNARDATTRGGTIAVETGHLRLTAARADVAATVPKGTYARLTVRDTGTGMTPEVATRAFEPFFTTKPSESGTGLGLFTVAESVKQMGGYVWAQSTPGHGSAFTVLLPLTDERKGEAAAQARVLDRRALQGLKVALVEDEDPLRRFVADALRRHGVEVLEFASASEAMPVLTTSDVCVDVLLTDVILPGMSGPELAQRATAVHPDLKTLYMSGYTPEEFGFAELLARAPVLKKPFHADELFEHVLMCAG
jgi:signal transduction histidine kinase